MATIETKYDIGDEVYLLEYGGIFRITELKKIKIGNVGYNHNGVFYEPEEVDKYDRERYAEPEIIGKIQDAIEWTIEEANKLIETIKSNKNKILYKLADEHEQH